MTFLQYEHGTIRTFLKGHMYFLHAWKDLCTKTFWSNHYQNCCKMSPEVCQRTWFMHKQCPKGDTRIP